MRKKSLAAINLLSLLILLFNYQCFAQGVTSDTTEYLLGSNLDNYSDWSLSRQSGTSGTLVNYNGLKGDGLKISYTFPSSGGWVTMERPIGSSYTKTNPMVFFVYSTSSSEKLEIKFIDSDGSVFDIRPSLSNYYGKWVHVTAYLDNASYAWGGNSTFDTPFKFSLAISGSSAGSGTVYIDEVGVGKVGLPSSFLPTIDPNSELSGIGFLQRRDSVLNPEDPLVLKFLETMQDQGSAAGELVPTYPGGAQAQTFNNCLTAMSFIVKDEKERAERILDFYLNATDSTNTDSLKQNFFYKGEARGFFQECDINTLKATGAKNRWIGDMAWLLITCKNYEKVYQSDRYEYLVRIIMDLFISFYKEADIGGYIQHGWEYGDTKLHEDYGHHEGNIDCYVAIKLCGEEYYAQKIKIWLDDQLDGKTSLPLDLYTWRALAFGALDYLYVSLLNIPEYDFRYRKIIDVNGNDVMGMFSGPDITINNFWNDGTGHISCAFQSFGDKQRGYFYANQLDPLIVSQIVGTTTTHGVPYTLNTQGYAGVNPKVAVVSSSAWYILAKNGCNPFLSEGFTNVAADPLYLLKNKSLKLQVFPNPFSNEVSINCRTKSNAGVVINIYNSAGTKINEIDGRTDVTGNYSVTWNGKDFNGYSINSGVYLIQLISENQTETTRVLYLDNENH